MTLEVGQVIDGKYRVVRLIGEGGMGAVFEGENTLIARRVAIKVLHAAMLADETVVTRFEREAQAAGRIGNDHILEILDLGSLPDGSRYMVMEFLDGEPLTDRIKNMGRLTPAQLYPLVRQLASGLGAAHRAGIIHRDLKPDNVFVLREKAGQPDYVKIIDFGISKFNPMARPDEGGLSMTRTGTVMGTPYYMAPEQANGSAPADARSDIYAVGVIMYEALTGRVPFDASTFNELLFKIVLSEPEPLEQVVPGIDPAFAAIVSKAMAREGAARFQATEELVEALDQWAQGGGAQAGAGVPVPVATPAGGQPYAHPQTPAQGQAPALPQGTGAAWAQQTPQPPQAKKPPLALFAAIAALLTILLVGATAALVFTRGSGDDAEEAAAAASAEAEKAAEENAAEEKAGEEKAKADEKAAEEKAEADEKAAEEKAEADEKAADAGGEEKPETAVAAKPAPAPSPGSRPVVRPRPRPRPAPTPKPTSTKPDFGY